MGGNGSGRSPGAWSRRLHAEQVQVLDFALLRRCGWRPEDSKERELPTGEVIRFTATRQPFGGQRWWMRCPRCRRRSGKLYLPAYPGAQLACRICHRLRYSSQSEVRGQRLQRRAEKLYARLGTTRDAMVHYKPKGMRWATFNRLLDEADRLYDEGWLLESAPFLATLGIDPHEALDEIRGPRPGRAGHRRREDPST